MAKTRVIAIKEELAVNTELKTIAELHDISKIGELFLLSFYFTSAI